MTIDDLMNQGMTAARNGQRDAARQSFQQVLRQDPRYIQAWLWLSGVVDSAQQKRDCLQRVLAMDPANQIALQGMQQLAQSEAASFLATFEPRPAAPPPAAAFNPPAPAPAPMAGPAMETAPAVPEVFAPIPIKLADAVPPTPTVTAPAELPPVSQVSEAPCRFCGAPTGPDGECRACGYEQIYDCPNCGRPLDLREGVLCECGQSMQQFLIDHGIDRERLGDVYMARDYPGAAVKQWKAAVAGTPRPAQLHRKIANVYLDLGLIEQARLHNELSKQR